VTATAPTAPDPLRWKALFVIAIAQLMVILDASIVNIALPKAQEALGISAANRQWVVTAYTLAFGGLLLLGGRIADYAGRKRVFIIGLLGFAGASALGGFAPDQALLFTARALQGAFGAILAPAALSLISVTFTDSKERAKAFGVYGALSGAGAAIGLIAGGLLTEYASWRWCLFVNIPMALIAAGFAIPFVRESRLEGKTKYDVPGALLSTAGFVALVYGITEAATPGKGWGSTSTIGLLLGGVVLLVAFIIYESRATQPLLPLGVLLDRVRGGSFLAQFFLAGGIFGMFLFMTFYFQDVHGFTPVRAGLCFLPFSLGVITSATIGSQLIGRVGPRLLASCGMLLASGGLLYLSFLQYDSSYWGHVFPAMLMMSFGLGGSFVSISSTALFGVPHHESGIASAVLNTSQQIGGSLGTAIFNTVAISATTAFAIAHPWTNSPLKPGTAGPDAMTHGFDMAFRLGALSMLIAAVTYFVCVNVDRHHLGQNDVGDGPSPLESALFEGATGEI
jgi:EmrB/QacA subfamily drug resistance transporter